MIPADYSLPRWRELPSIDLYSDQVVTLVNRALAPLPLTPQTSGRKKDAGALSKTMLNNYVKARLIAPPIKKQYGRAQVSRLIVLCVLKQVFTMQEIAALTAATEHPDGPEPSYDRFCALFEAELRASAPAPEETSSAGLQPSQLLTNALRTAAYMFRTKELLSALPSPAAGAPVPGIQDL